MTWCAYSVPLLVVSDLLLRKSYNLDPDGRTLPHTTVDAIRIVAHSAALQAVIGHSIPQPSPLLPTPGSPLLKAVTAARPAWHIIPVLIAAVTFIAMLPSPSTAPPWHGRVRELLTMHTVQEGISVWWWAVAGLAAGIFVVVLEPPPLAPFIEFWYVSLACCKHASMHIFPGMFNKHSMYKTRYQRHQEKKTAKMMAMITRKMEAQGTPLELSGEVYSIDEGSVPYCLRDVEPLNPD